MQYCAVRVWVVFVTVELVNIAKTVNLYVGPRLTNRQGDLSMQLVTTKQVHQTKQTQIYCAATTEKGNIEGPGLTALEQWVHGNFARAF